MKILKSDLSQGAGNHIKKGTKMTIISYDNQAGRELAYNPEHHAKTKHIQRRHFCVRELVEDFRITVPFVRSEANDADFFTKPLKATQFFALRDRIMNISS